ncbi:uncharacterized protein MONOS_9386 [Monocercomonoides exilis]|uniref:uncharacterized protein n=1 Tax=Monocercomonoides exilis TaxID=2049356 RepID=UPI00355982B8|nr:hypothetical protein MONOS_9386 [Monocercomonoides exilis]|eukprot:MONOS_9386.1-p1 / transcript=MONOS_9386.1 / gene=MONOS_9386 / organism=Monocercomonoides_exilis_PA203 / gene_product=unspecified product / transcript_product=unspecified product / location=Mono_scaffold00386:35415-35928(+) / protein_length=75 / sequence_SO=supercontig / SO=protein_coding / is_pseudo=false
MKNLEIDTDNCMSLFIIRLDLVGNKRYFVEDVVGPNEESTIDDEFILDFADEHFDFINHNYEFDHGALDLEDCY